MTLKYRMAGFVLAALMVSAFAAACSSESTSDIIQTTQADNANRNATATAAARGTPQVSGSPTLPQLQATASAATATARAQSGGGTPQASATSGTGEITPPEGPALTDADNPTVEIGTGGIFDPEIIKVKVGTTVTWVKPGRTASSTTSLEGEAEQWDSGNMSKPTFGDAPTFSHTFTIPGCHRYRSTTGNDLGGRPGAVCVEE